MSAGGAHGRRFYGGVVAGNSRSAEKAHGASSEFYRRPAARFGQSTAIPCRSANGGGKAKGGGGQVFHALPIRLGQHIRIVLSGPVPDFLETTVGPLIGQSDFVCFAASQPVGTGISSIAIDHA